ncbi:MULTISPECIES: MBL fold metallo-hydrolase [unclassified Paenibacillus]|uniref:MBL fold metallo-hydrolase n=1 Tax=unclassified Paenibacillus TaxID=185978 RepID=UPI0036D3CA9F
MTAQVVALPGGWLQVKVPLPFSLKWVNSYIVPERGRVTVIDPGLGTDEARSLWDEVLSSCHLKWPDIKRVLLTHQHPDHYGLAGYMQQKSGCPVYMTSRAHRYALRLWEEDSTFADDLRELYVPHGMPEHLMDAIENNLSGFVSLVSPQPKVDYFEPGGILELGGASWEIIDAPGHAFGGVCLYQRETRWMVCGDQVLPRITPNVSVVPGEEADPLDYFLNSLAELRSYEVHYALPGHRDPFDRFKERIEELLDHHARRLKEMGERLAEQSQTAFALCEEQFGKHLRENPHNLRFAMSETLAHLYFLEQRGIIVSDRQDGCIVYRKPTGSAHATGSAGNWNSID